MPNIWEVDDYPYAHTSNPYAGQQPGQSSYGSGSSSGSSSSGSNWNSPHPGNAAYTSDDGLISYDSSGYQLDSLGNRAFGSWPNSGKGGAAAGNGAQLGNWYSQPMGQTGVPNYSLTAWGRPADWWTNPANQQVAQAESAYYMPWQQQLFNQYTTGQQYDNANQQWLWNAGWGAQQDMYNMGLTGAQTYADIDQGYGTLEQNALANMYDYNLGMGGLANDQGRTNSEAYANIYRPYMEAGANMYNADSQFTLGLADLENQQLLESMRQFGRNQAPNVRAMRQWY